MRKGSDQTEPTLFLALTETPAACSSLTPTPSPLSSLDSDIYEDILTSALTDGKPGGMWGH